MNHDYSVRGSRTHRVESYTGFTSATDAYTYDLTDQLTGVSYNSGARTTSFDYGAPSPFTSLSRC